MWLLALMKGLSFWKTLYFYFILLLKYSMISKCFLVKAKYFGVLYLSKNNTILFEKKLHYTINVYAFAFISAPFSYSNFTILIYPFSLAKWREVLFLKNGIPSCLKYDIIMLDMKCNHLWSVSVFESISHIPRTRSWNARYSAVASEIMVLIIYPNDLNSLWNENPGL